MRSIQGQLLLAALVLCAPLTHAAQWGLVGNSTSDSAAIFHYDVQDGQFVIGESIPLGTYGNYPYDAVFRPRSDDEVWIPGASGDGVVVVDEAGTLIKEIATGEYPTSIAFSPDYGIALVSCRDSDRLDIIDIDQYEVIGSLPIPGAGLGPGNLIFDPRGNRFFLVEWYGDLVFTIAPDGSSILDQASVGDSLWQLAIDPNLGGSLFLTDRGTDQVRVLDPETLTQTRTVDVGDDPWGIDVDDTIVIVCCEDSHDVYRIDIYDWSVISVVLASDADPRDVNISTGLMVTGLPDGSKTLVGAAAYVCGGQSSAGNLVHVLDLYDLTMLDTIVSPGTNTNVVAVEAQWPLPSAVGDLPGAALLQLKAAPNPFNPQTTFSFVLAEAADVTLGVFDAGGRLVKRIAAGTLGAGTQRIGWDGSDQNGRRCASGTYLVTVLAGDQIDQTKVVLVQ